jgi:hypothetical protein
MKSAVMAWAKPTRVFVIGKRLENFKVYESSYEKVINIFRVPTGQQLMMKPEGQRRWNTETVYTDTDIDLKVDDKIIFDCADSQRFRIIDKTDWKDYGFIEYKLQSDYF